jgi:hypothetical protein
MLLQQTIVNSFLRSVSDLFEGIFALFEANLVRNCIVVNSFSYMFSFREVVPTKMTCGEFHKVVSYFGEFISGYFDLLQCIFPEDEL